MKEEKKERKNDARTLSRRCKVGGKFWKKFGDVCSKSYPLFLSGEMRRFRISLMNLKKGGSAHIVLIFSICLSFNDRATLFRTLFTQHQRCVMWLNILNLRRNNFLTIKFTPKLIVTLSTGHVPANERTSWEFIMFSSRDLMRVESRKHSATISKVKLDILK